MDIRLLNDRLRFTIRRAKEDPEKAVLPTLSYVNTNHEAFGNVRHRGFMLAIGWWDWLIIFGYFYKNRINDNKKTNHENREFKFRTRSVL